MKKYKHIGIYLKSVALISGLLFLACTQDEEIASNSPTKSDVVTFVVENSNKWEPDVIGGSRSRTLALPMDCAEGELPEGEIYMYMMEEEYTAEVDTASADSRSSISTPDIGIYAYKYPRGAETEAPAYNPATDGITAFMDNVNLTTYNTEGSTKVYWPGADSWLKFFAYQPYCNSNTSVAGLTLSATGNNPTFTYSVPTTVLDQSNLMVAAPSMYAGESLEPVEMNLVHVLSKIQVKVGDLGCGYVKSISFENIYSDGTYPFNSGTWDVVTGDANKVKNYEQNGLTDASVSATDKIIGKPFYLLPQTLNDDATIKIVLEVTTNNPAPTGENDKTRTATYTLSKKIKEFKNAWEKDKQYTYVITTPQQVDVEVTDEVNGKRKENLVIKNIGLSPAYIRALIIGNWVTFEDDNVFNNHEEGTEITDGKKIVAEWKAEHGTFDWGLGGSTEHPTLANKTASSTWFKGDDGYYYCTKQIEPGNETPKLFQSYELTASPPMAGAVLELIIAVQAVYPDDVQHIWDSSVVTALGINGSN